jgi:hypothetical protein
MPFKVVKPVFPVYDVDPSMVCPVDTMYVKTVFRYSSKVMQQILIFLNYSNASFIELRSQKK